MSVFETALLELNFDMSEIEYQRPNPNVPVKIIRTFRGSPPPKSTEIICVIKEINPPPPPSTPHPTVLEDLVKIPVPDRKMGFGTKRQTIPLELVARLTSINRERIPIILEGLKKEAETCGDLHQFQALLQAHISRVHELVTANRSIAVSYCRTQKLSGQVTHANKFAFFKRVSVWREALSTVLKLSEMKSKWDEERRNFLWRRLIHTNRFSWYSYNLAETFPMASYISNQKE